MAQCNYEEAPLHETSAASAAATAAATAAASESHRGHQPTLSID